MHPTASREEITRAYRALAARYHPDKHQDNVLRDLAEEKLAELNEAYNVLSNPAKRAAYDGGRAQTASPPPGTSPGAPPPVQFSLGRIISLLGLVAAIIVGMRFLRSPRINLLLGLVLLIVWFGPRLYRRFKAKR